MNESKNAGRYSSRRTIYLIDEMPFENQQSSQNISINLE